MTTTQEEREAALAAADETCPRCGAARETDQEYCVECGLKLPPVTGTVPSLRRRWVRRVGWYPGDWVWVSILTLLVAAIGAGASIFVTSRDGSSGSTIVAPPTQPVRQPTTPPATTPANTATLPVAPEPTTTTRKPPASAPVGRTVWPAGKSGWTLVLISYPKQGGLATALATATRAAKAGLADVGVLDSGRYSSLHPGYYVVFSGVYGSKDRADAALRTARSSGFAGAYSRPVSR